MSVSDSRRLATLRLPRQPSVLAEPDVDAWTGQIPMPPGRLLAILLGVALVGAASALVALLVVLIAWWT